jgi:selenocysteine lyase/cysteine desulfurase
VRASYKHLFSRSLGAAPARVHFASHSHHLWPDASYEGHLRAWDDAARLADTKWDKVFGEVYPSCQAHVAHALALRDPASVVFAPNTHELLVRIASAIGPDGSQPRAVLSTDSEFHSFQRQSARFAEIGAWAVERVPTEPLDSFAQRFVRALESKHWDLVFLSHVFFNSGWIVTELSEVLAHVPAETTVIVDGYHGFFAIPTSFSSLADRVFYVAGGYKYAMSGEGACFAHVPPSFYGAPSITGWFASFGTLSGRTSDRVPFAPGAARFLGSTFDPTALYRFDAVMTMLRDEGLTPAVVREHTSHLQQAFLERIGALRVPFLCDAPLVVQDAERRGGFVTFRCDRATEIQTHLQENGVICDARGDRLRFGFGPYLDETDVFSGTERVYHALNDFR